MNPEAPDLKGLCLLLTSALLSLSVQDSAVNKHDSNCNASVSFSLADRFVNDFFALRPIRTWNVGISA